MFIDKNYLEIAMGDHVAPQSASRLPTIGGGTPSGALQRHQQHALVYSSKTKTSVLLQMRSIFDPTWFLILRTNLRLACPTKFRWTYSSIRERVRVTSKSSTNSWYCTFHLPSVLHNLFRTRCAFQHFNVYFLKGPLPHTLRFVMLQLGCD